MNCNIKNRKRLVPNSRRITVMVSGGMDPIHKGHIRLIQAAAKYGGVIVVLNSDEWLKRKKGYVFMPFEERAEIVSAIKGVIKVTDVDDSDGTVIEAICRLKPTYFANGGDRGKDNTPEMAVCEIAGVEMLWSVGGDEKANSSSELVERVRNRKA